ncbi:hypothetical protein A3D00_02060 [Candidatus Woesebacteria bacterium RIFCSPHIGHO2_02_FULL_38_9]|uniref:Uncharacterized protein n=1 Tax=Candidatus Woesebacteria bacterium RIFCSPHIGHO2_01_FULL_39_28 TaxID=1802496 RepID=A0A1F7YK64_9BACT|nr:MAG: hypothetical protein A2627_04560 [Candidatus Woesebacteria bacterium RIFCSPHIGHO2_01_FULL_39_28]OGM34146.1 MAG: hypothetical protein A3D00_02060 [Candidatus Woesebacteria bacterium RIFCSPHIGHO2_02_FULL_38_9]OGM57062.1 MAG: hypothetical protein A3A50_05365 [Candidatus Woesebacteria bacterium RIFCSPLOWO2_01_FULL_38_20]
MNDDQTNNRQFSPVVVQEDAPPAPAPEVPLSETQVMVPASQINNPVNTFSPDIQNPTVVAPPSPSKKFGTKNVIATIFVIAVLVVGLAAGIVLVQRQQYAPTQAWDCSKYSFNITKEGVVSLVNSSTRDEPSQKADVLINNIKITTLDVPALKAGASATLGTVSVPENGIFDWSVNGTLDCKNSGHYEGQTTPTPQISASCKEIKTYNTAWNILTTIQLSKLNAGDKVRFTVQGSASSGTFDKAKFSVNGTITPEVTSKKPGTEEFYYEYTVKESDLGSNMSVTAWVHHQTLNQWF